MAQKTPCDREEGIIDLFDIVDDPEASPQPEPCGAVHVGGGTGHDVPEPAEREEGSGWVVSRYPFENVDEFQNISENSAFGDARKAPESATPPADDGPAEAEPEVSSEALIRAFEEEMAKAGAVARESGGGDEPDDPCTPDMPEATPERSVDGAVGMPDEDLGGLFGAEVARDGAAPAERETPSAEREPVWEEAFSQARDERADDGATLEDLFPERSVAPEEPVFEAEPDLVGQPEDVVEPDPVASQSSEPESGESEPVAQQSCEAECVEPESDPQSVEPDPAMTEPQVEEPVAKPEPLSEPELPPLAELETFEEVPVEAVAPVPSESDDVEERLTRLEEALSRLNERVTALEQRVNESAEETPAGAALSGDIEALLTEGNALCGQLRALAASREPVSSVASEPKFIPEPDPEEASASEPSSVGTLSGEPEPVAFDMSDDDDGPDLLGLALESLEGRVSVLEKRPVLAAPDAAGIAQDVLALVRVDMEKASEEQETTARVLEQLQRRVQDLEARPLPQLILPDLPDAEAITADVMSRIQAEIDRVAAESAARVLREEIANLMKQ